MSSSLSKHYCICNPSGAVQYDEDNRAEIYGSKKAAEHRIIEIQSGYKWLLHVEVVQIQ